jgi:polyisoprenoid-binding protein YceI
MKRNIKLQPGDSEIRILVYRAGMLSKLAHNHIIVSHHLEGELTWDAENPHATTGFLQVPVSNLSVDLEEHRHQLGGEFESFIPQADIETVREKMLGSEILDEKHYPWVKAEILSVEGTAPNYTIQTNLQIRSHTQPIAIPFTLVHEDSPFKAYGEFPLWQSHFGIKPINFLMGAIKVQDRILIQFVINQTRTP